MSKKDHLSGNLFPRPEESEKLPESYILGRSIRSLSEAEVNADNLPGKADYAAGSIEQQRLQDLWASYAADLDSYDTNSPMFDKTLVTLKISGALQVMGKLGVDGERAEQIRRIMKKYNIKESEVYEQKNL